MFNDETAEALPENQNESKPVIEELAVEEVHVGADTPVPPPPPPHAESPWQPEATISATDAVAQVDQVARQILQAEAASKGKEHAEKLASAHESLQAMHDMIGDHLKSNSAIPVSAVAGNAVTHGFLHHLKNAIKHVGDVAKDIGLGAAEVAGEIVAGASVRDE